MDASIKPPAAPIATLADLDEWLRTEVVLSPLNLNARLHAIRVVAKWAGRPPDGIAADP